MEDLIFEEVLDETDADNVEYVRPEDISECDDIPERPEYISTEPPHHHHHHPHPHHHGCSPMDLIRKLKSDPSKINVLKHGDRYYIDFHDLKHYMHHIGSHNYDSAVHDIVRAHDDDPGFDKTKLRVLMGSSYLQNCSPAEKASLETAHICIDVY